MEEHDPISELELFRSQTDERSVTRANQFIAHRNRRNKNPHSKFPEDWLFGFFPSVYSVLRQSYHAVEIRHLNPMHPVSIFDCNGQQFACVFPGFGAPLSGAILDEAIALGAERILFFGKAGSLDTGIARNGLIIPTSAVRDEGTSFHYLPPERYSLPDPVLVSSLESVLTNCSIPYRKGPVWTTDAPYRETPSQISRLKKEGCIAVDMEASALFAIGKHFGKRVAGFFVISDIVTESKWIMLGDTILKPIELIKLAVDALANIGHHG